MCVCVCGENLEILKMIPRSPPQKRCRTEPISQDSPILGGGSGSNRQLVIYEDVSPTVKPLNSSHEPSDHLLCTYQCRQMVRTLMFMLCVLYMFTFICFNLLVRFGLLNLCLFVVPLVYGFEGNVNSNRPYIFFIILGLLISAFARCSELRCVLLSAFRSLTSPLFLLYSSPPIQ